MIIDRTTAICRHCQQSHPAEIVHENGKIEGVVHCPATPYRHLLSSHPEMYLELRQRSVTPIDDPPPPELRLVLNYLSITNACNFSCTICAADARTATTGVFLSLEEILARVASIPTEKRGLLYLIGGEPTLHPELEKIIERLAAWGFNLALASNGYLLGRDPSLAKRLKIAGLKRLALQFDSFEEKTLGCYARDALKEKNEAFRLATAAGLDVHLNCTVSSLNLPELGRLLAQGLEAGPRVRNLTFMVAAPTGRFTLVEPEVIDKEMVALALLKEGEDYLFTFADFLPLPSYLPWGLQVHPDCGVHIPFVRTPRRIFPLNHIVDLAAWYRLLASSRLRRQGVWSQRLVPLLFLLRSFRRGTWSTVINIALGWLFRRKSYSLVNLSISDYRAAMFLDEKRLARCASAYHTSVGPVSGCSYFFRDQSLPGSRLSEVEQGKC